GLLVFGLLIFSLGSFSVVFYLLSLGFPDYAARILETNLLLGNGNSRYPQLYDGLMLFLLLVYAPLVEELIFRGILLQRWGAKWGLRWGLGASSLMFGLLHFNNPLGLTLFGLVMGLLYIRTRSLWMPIMCHALNNLAAVGIDGMSRLTGGTEAYTIEDVQAAWWGGLILMGMSAPFLLRFVWLNWPSAKDKIPYLLNVDAGNRDRVN
ncbi:MAG: CPBP family intramembrane glutamic endopeptidase, partial [Phormidesmis sp.]